jgi:hypothetical protein
MVTSWSLIGSSPFHSLDLLDLKAALGQVHLKHWSRHCMPP